MAASSLPAAAQERCHFAESCRMDWNGLVNNHPRRHGGHRFIEWFERAHEKHYGDVPEALIPLDVLQTS